MLRGFPKQQVFAQTIFCFELANADPRFVGINLVMPEDGYTSMTDYALHMRMVQFLHPLYPKVHISLHAGEIAPGLVPTKLVLPHPPGRGTRRRRTRSATAWTSCMKTARTNY